MLQILEPDAAPKLGDHITCDGEPETGATPLGFGRKEWFEDFLTDFLWHP